MRRSSRFSTGSSDRVCRATGACTLYIEIERQKTGLEMVLKSLRRQVESRVHRSGAARISDETIMETLCWTQRAPVFMETSQSSDRRRGDDYFDRGRRDFSSAPRTFRELNARSSLGSMQTDPYTGSRRNSMVAEEFCLKRNESGAVNWTHCKRFDHMANTNHGDSKILKNLYSRTPFIWYLVPGKQVT